MNKTLLIGHLGRDVEIRYSQNGLALANVSLATNEKWTDETTGEKREKTEWHRLVAFNKIAENLAQYTGKGSKIFVEGELRTRQYEKDGITRYITEVKVVNVEFLSYKEKNSNPVNRPVMDYPEQYVAPRKEYVGVTYNDDDDDDEIPFY